MARAPRQAISKGLRYDVFARDNFTCRYCGRKPGDVVLVIDHIIPVAKGGDNDPTNLLTSCAECNAGKAAKLPQEHIPPTTDFYRLEQERAELEQAAKALLAKRTARESLVDAAGELLCSITGRDDFHVQTAKILAGFVHQHGADLVREWVGIARDRLPEWKLRNDRNIGRYVSGIRKRWLAQEIARQEPDDEYEDRREELDAEDEAREAALRSRPRTPDQQAGVIRNTGGIL